MTLPPALAAKLTHVHVLIVDGDKRIALLVREVLTSIGFGHIYIASDGAEGLHILKMHPVDLIITDWKMEPVDGIDFIRYIRTSPDSPNKRIPIIMLSASVEKDNVYIARDVGVTEFVLKPFTTKSLLDRIVRVVENPRSFIISKDFKGPDRRRRKDDASKDSERRSPRQPSPKAFISKREENTLTEADTVHVLAPDYELKRKIGDEADVRDLLKPSVVQETQKIITRAQQDFTEWVAKDFAAMEHACYAAEHDETHDAPFQLAKISRMAFTILSEAGIFGYTLASEVAKSLHIYCENHPQPTPDVLLVVRHHIDALRSILHLAIDGSGGRTGSELLEGLQELIKKYP